MSIGQDMLCAWMYHLVLGYAQEFVSKNVCKMLAEADELDGEAHGTRT